MDLSYEEVRNCFRFERNKRERVINSLFGMVENILTVDDIEYFYPKNIFNETGNIEFIIISDEKFISVYESNESKMKMKICKLSDIDRVELTEGDKHFDGSFLLITFGDYFSVECNSEVDSNESWKFKYKEAINALVKLLVKNRT